MSPLDDRLQYVALEIMEEIMLKLPVKSLVRFMCISKPCYTLIRSSSFISKHTSSVVNKSKENPTLLTLIQVGYWDDVWILHSMYNKNKDFVVNIEGLFLKALPEIEYEEREEDFCDGLLYIHTPGMCVLWNPSVRKALKIPLPVTESTGSEHVGLCYDYISQGYKLIFVEQICYSNSQAKVYELNKKEWRKISSVPVGPLQHHQPALVKGALHWIGLEDTTSHRSVIVFDVSTEVFGTIELPFALFSNKFSKVVRREETLACLHAPWGSSFWGNSFWDIWVMKQYGVSSSWTKMCRVDLGTVGLSYPSLRLMKNNQLLVLTSNAHLVFDFGNEKPIPSRNFGTSGTALRTLEYMETLALLN